MDAAAHARGPDRPTGSAAGAAGPLADAEMPIHFLNLVCSDSVK